MELLCKWCGETKPDFEFLRRNKNEPYSQKNVRCCKACNAAKNRERYKVPEIREKQLSANSKWRDEHREKMEEYKRAFHERTPDRMKARNRIGYLVRSGSLVRQPCCICGSNEQVEAHHDSYAKEHWDRVRWLCKEHHERWHQVLDPIKDPIVRDPLKMSKARRHEAAEILKQIHSLRIQYRHLVQSADEVESEAWGAVIEKSDDLFEQTFGVHS